MKITDLDWRSILNDWDESDIRYLMSICQEKLNQRPRRKILIRGEDQ